MAAQSLGTQNLLVYRKRRRSCSGGGLGSFRLSKPSLGLFFLEDAESYFHYTPNRASKDKPAEIQSRWDFNEVQGQNDVLEFVTVAAEGGHNSLLIGSPGCGKPMVAKRIPIILPSLSREDALEADKIFSVAGLLKNRGSHVTTRPFRAPHHNASTNSLIGGGYHASLGEIPLAHNGLLFLDEIAELTKGLWTFCAGQWKIAELPFPGFARVL